MRKWLIHAFALLLVFVPVLSSVAGEASAATSRVAVIKELKGTVKVKKAGGSKEFTAFAKMSLNEGDVLIVGDNGSAMLQFSNGTSEDDKMTVSANSKLTFSKLSDKNGTTTKVSLWSGSAWTDVKSIKSKNDQFSLETPTAVMGVRGTHLFTQVDPVTGATQMMVAAGIVSVRTKDQDQTEHRVYPTQNILVTKDEESGDSTKTRTSIAPADLPSITRNAGAFVALGILRSIAEIQAENANLKRQYTEEQQVPRQDLSRVEENLQNFAAALVNQLMKDRMVDQSTILQFIEEANRQLQQSQQPGIDLSKGELTLSEEERAKQQRQREMEEAAKEIARRIKEMEQGKKNKELAGKLKEEKEKQKQENEKLLESKKQKAFEEYEALLDALEKERLRQDKAARDAEAASASAVPTPIVSGGDQGGSESFVSPLKSLTIHYTTPEDLAVSEVPPSAYDIPVTLSSGQITQSINDLTHLVELKIQRLDEGELAHGDLRVTSNGIPAEIYRDYEDDFGELYDLAYVPLNRETNVIVIEVKPAEADATPSNVKRVTLTLTRPTTYSGLDFISPGVNWTSVLPGDNDYIPSSASSAGFAASVQDYIDTLTLTPDISNSSFVGAALICEPSNCADLVIDDENYMISNLQPNEVYIFKLKYMHQNGRNFPYYFMLRNGVEAPDWDALFEENFSLYIPQSELIALERTGDSVYQAQVGPDAERVSLGLDSSILYDYLHPTVINSRTWETEENMACEEADGYCLQPEDGDNQYIIYLTDYSGYLTHSYVLNINKTNLPYGVDDWSISYYSENELMTSQLRHECYYIDCDYFAFVANSATLNDVKLNMTLDGSKIGRYRIHADVAAPSPQMVDLTDPVQQSVSIDLSTVGESAFPEAPGTYSFNLKLYERDSEHSETYIIKVFIDDIQPPLRFADLFTNDEVVVLDARWGGDRTLYVYSPDEVSTIYFYALSPSVSYMMCYMLYEYGCESPDSESGYFEYYPGPGESSFTIALYDFTHEDPYEEYTVVVYNGIEGINPSDYALTITSEAYNGEFINDLEFYGEEISFTSSDVQSGKELVGVYDEYGNVVTDKAGTYTLRGPTHKYETYYVVVRDEEDGYVMPTKVIVRADV